MDTGHSILIASASAQEAEKMESLLKKEGHSVLRAFDGNSASGIIERRRPALAILEENLPIKNGISVLKEIRQAIPSSEMLVVMTSDHVSLQAIQEAMPLGLSGFIQTPFQDEIFIAEVKKLLATVKHKEPTADNPTERLSETTESAATENKISSSSSGRFSAQKNADDDEDEHDADDSRPDSSLSPALGQFDDNADEPDIEIPVGKNKTAHPFPVSPELLDTIKKRLAILGEIDKLEERRSEMLNKEGGIPEQAKNELLRQAAESKAMPDQPTIKAKMSSFTDRMSKLRERLEAGDKEAVPPSRDLEEAWSIGQEQWILILEWNDLLLPVLKAAIPTIQDEPLYKVLSKYKFPAHRMFGLTAFHLALETMQQKGNAQRKELHQKAEEMQNDSAGFLKKFKSKDDTEIIRVRNNEANVIAQISHIQTELNLMATTLSKEFWKLYELAACLLVSNKLDRNEEVAIRAFLRYGLIGRAPWFLSPEISQLLIKDCTQDIQDVDFSMGAMHIYYADEHIAHTVAGKVLPAIDEDLELNQRNSPRWFADKAHRRVIYCNYQEKALQESWDKLQAKINELRRDEAETQELKDKLIRSSPDYKEKNNVYAQKIQHCRVEAARYERVIEEIREKFIPDLSERREMAQEKLADSTAVQSVFDIARREANQIHRVTRLCAKLKDPFLPFVLRDNYKPDQKSVNNRQTMISTINEIEAGDPTIFKIPLVPAKRENNKIYMRFCPLILLTPGCGFMGYSWNPRSGVESGKLVFPGYCPRPGLLQSFLYNTIADFRWDTSKAEAGVDVLTSDTIVAAYQTMRWENRKRSKDVREKELIFNEMSDRQNWRRHYCLYLESANEAGKKLFFRCFSAYEVITRYVPLPEGMEKLRK